MNVDVVTSEGLHERLGQTVGLPAAHRGEAGNQAQADDAILSSWVRFKCGRFTYWGANERDTAGTHRGNAPYVCCQIVEGSWLVTFACGRPRGKWG